MRKSRPLKIDCTPYYILWRHGEPNIHLIGRLNTLQSLQFKGLFTIVGIISDS
jgi:hypothetical protein